MIVALVITAYFAFALALTRLFKHLLRGQSRPETPFEVEQREAMTRASRNGHRTSRERVRKSLGRNEVSR